MELIEKYRKKGDNFCIKLTIDELKEIILQYYYPFLEEERKYNTKQWKDEISRELIITKIKDNYGKTGTVVISLNGSPPKGVAVYQSQGGYEGYIVLFGNGRVSKKHNIKLDGFE